MATVAQILEKFEDNPALWTKAIRDRIQTDSSAFCQEMIAVLRQAVDNAAFRTAGSKALTLILCDPDLLTEEQARRLAERLKSIGLVFERGIFEEVFGKDGTGGSSAANPAYGLRFLQIFAQNASNGRLPSMLGGLLHHPNAKIRSKVTALVGRVTNRFDWVEQIRDEGDERVRANALEALWQPGVPEHCRSTLWASVNDGNNRVAGNALLGLYRQGDPGCIPLITTLTGHAEEKFRATAAWIIGQTGDERFRERLLPLLDDGDECVRQNAAQALKKLEETKLHATEEIQLLTFPVRDAASSKQILRIAAVSPQGGVIPPLLATDFRVWRNGVPIESYTVERRAAPEGIGITYAFPRTDAHHSDLRQKWAGILTRCFPQKRRLDYWGLMAYGEESASAPAEAKSKPVFVRNSLELEDFAHAMMALRDKADLSKALELLLTPPPFVRNGFPVRKESIHAVIIDLNGSCELPQDLLTAIEDSALKSDVVIHAASVDRSSPLAGLTRATGGTFLVSRGRMESVGREMLAIYHAVLLSYQIEFESSPADETGGTEIRVGIRRGAFFGETTIAGEACLAPVAG